MSDLTDSELALALNGECHTAEVATWLAREVKRHREVQHFVVQESDLTNSELKLALNGECHTVEAIVWLAREAKRYREAQHAVGKMLEIFPFVTALHREVVLRPKDGKSQDVEMTPDEADRVATILVVATAKVTLNDWYSSAASPRIERPTSRSPVSLPSTGAVWDIRLSGNADVEIFSSTSEVPLEDCRVVLRHKDGESQDVVLTLIEANQVAEQLRVAAAAARAGCQDTQCGNNS